MVLSQCLDIRTLNPMAWLAEVVPMAQAVLQDSAVRSDEPPDDAVDIEDVRRCRSGDGEAYRRLVERHQGRVASMMWRFSRDPESHEELVQNVFVEAYVSLPRYRPTGAFSHWLARIATRVGYRFWKEQARERAHPTVSLDEWDHLPADNPDEMAPSQAAELLHRLLGQLPPRDRLVLTLQFLEAHTVEQIARQTGWSRAMVKVQSWRARRKLKRLFEQTRREDER